MELIEGDLLSKDFYTNSLIVISAFHHTFRKICSIIKQVFSIFHYRNILMDKFYVKEN